MILGMPAPRPNGFSPLSIIQRAHIKPTKLRYSVTLGTSKPLAIKPGLTNVSGTRNTVRSHRSSMARVTPVVRGRNQLLMSCPKVTVNEGKNPGSLP